MLYLSGAAVSHWGVKRIKKYKIKENAARAGGSEAEKWPRGVLGIHFTLRDSTSGDGNAVYKCLWRELSSGGHGEEEE